MEWTTALPDWEERIVAGRSLIPCGPLFPEEAAAALEVFKALRVVDVPGAPTVGEIARRWILDFAAAFFGSYDPETGKRLIRSFYLKVPKKNWKSGITAFLMGTLLIRNWRESGEFGIIAPTTEVANNAFGPLKHAIRKDEELSDLLHIQDHIRTITHRTTKATLQVVAADSDTVSGKKFIVTLVEELWQFGKKHNAEAMLLEATGGMASREEGAVIYITTESDEPPAGVYRAKNLYARNVRSGEIVDPAFLPVLYEWPKAMVESKACLEIENAWIVNPNLGASVGIDWLRSKYEETKAESAQAFQAFVAKHLNVEIGLALQSNRWAGADFWEKQGDPALTLEAILSRSEVVTIGIDGGGLDDLFGLAVLGRDAATQDWLAWCHAYCASIALDRRKAEASTLRDFERDGDLEIVDALPGDVAAAVAVIKRVYERGLLGGIGIDPEKGYKVVYQALIDAGLPEDLIHGVSQGWRLVGAITVAERRLVDGSLRHSGSRLMNYCVGNARVVPRGNAVLITKEASGEGKIDPLMALLDAVDLMAMNPGRQTISIYEQLARDAAAQPAPRALAIPAAVSAAATPFEANRFDHQALQYIVNTAGQAGVAEFEDDFAPIGTRLWEHLAAAGLVTVDERGAVCLTAAGVAVLADETEEIEA
ncbi:MAG: terminase large subunit [Ideonella sp.]|nr:terminase large subunit [Ideonella sp.]